MELKSYLKERFELDLDTVEAVHEGQDAIKFLCSDQTDRGNVDIRGVKEDDQGAKTFKATPNTVNSTQFADRFNEEDYRRLATGLGIEWEEGYEKRVLPHVASDESVDSQGDIVLQDWDFSAFKDNPAMPFNHQWNELPVGAHIFWEVNSHVTNRYTGPALFLLSLYATAEQNPLAESVYRLAKAKFLRANSVGFYPKTVIVPSDADKSRLGMPDYGAILTNNLLLEDSPTLLGANEGALQILRRGKERGILTAVDMLAVRELNRLQVDADAFSDSDTAYMEMAKTLFPDSRYDTHKDADAPFDFTKEVITEVSTKNELAMVSAKVDALTAFLQTALGSLGIAVEDIRDTLEQITSNPDISDSNSLINGTTINSNQQLITLLANSSLISKLEKVSNS
jgi:hypothetical protein